MVAHGGVVGWSAVERVCTASLERRVVRTSCDRSVETRCCGWVYWQRRIAGSRVQMEAKLDTAWCE